MAIIPVTYAPNGKKNVPDPHRPDHEGGAAQSRSGEATSLRISHQTHRMEQDNDGKPTFSRGDESIDHNLCAIKEVSELGGGEGIRNRKTGTIPTAPVPPI